MFGQPTIPEMPKVKEYQKDIDSTLTVNGLPLIEYERLREADRELKELKKQIAACATVNVEAIEEKERKYREFKQKIFGGTLQERIDGKQPTEKQRQQLQKLENEFYEEEEKPQVSIDGNKITEIVMRFAAGGLEKNFRERHGYRKGLPKDSRVKIE